MIVITTVGYWHEVLRVAEAASLCKAKSLSLYMCMYMKDNVYERLERSTEKKNIKM